MREKFYCYLTVVIVACLILILLTPSYGAIGERILRFDSHITVHEDASMTVQETIKVQSIGEWIKHGIYRDFPTRYRGKFGNIHNVGFSVTEVLKDGAPEDHHFEGQQNGVRVYIGKKYKLLEPGIYTYTLTYKTDRQIGYFKDHDELYWNVTGNGWTFPMDQATATVDLPAEASRNILSYDAYTGPQGAKLKNFKASIGISNNILFTTTFPLNPFEGLTIVVSWPKGIVFEPTQQMRFNHFIEDNKIVVWGLVGLMIVFVYYLIGWVKAGRDPKKGIIVPLYTPPAGISPAVMRYIKKMGYDEKVLSCAIIHLAVKGFISINEENNSYVLTQNKIERKDLSSEEKKIIEKFFASNNTIALKSSNHEKMNWAIDALKNALRRQGEQVYFIANKWYFIPGLILSMIAFIFSLFGDETGTGISVGFGLLFSAPIGALILWIAIVNWRKALSIRKNRITSAIAGIFFSLLFILLFGFGLLMLSLTISPLFTIILLAFPVTNYLFYHLLKAPTRAGRNLLDKMEGFKLFLVATEKDRLNFLNPPDRTPELFEKYLPYALALDVEQVWAEQFTDILSEAGKEYSPDWYSGAVWKGLGTTGFVTSLGSSLGSTISSSSAAPGSSSGSGGGGSSGGGGGGGGGGGW